MQIFITMVLVTESHIGFDLEILGFTSPVFASNEFSRYLCLCRADHQRGCRFKKGGISRRGAFENVFWDFLKIREIENRVLACTSPVWGNAQIKTSNKSVDCSQAVDVKNREEIVMKRKVFKVVPLLVLAVLVLAGCATGIPLEAQRTPSLDTSDIQRVAVVPFSPGVMTPDHQAIASTLTSEVAERLAETGAFTLVSYHTVSAARARGADISEYVDALLVGRVTRFTSNVVPLGPLQATTRDELEARAAALNPIAGAVARTAAATAFPRHRLVVDVAFDYYFVRARDGFIIGPIGRAGRSTRGNDNPGALPPALTVATGIIGAQLSLFYRDVVPHTVVIRRTLESESDAALRPQMNAAQALVRQGNFMAALDSYIAIWEGHGSIAAAINASILYEAIGELERAIDFMYGVVAATGAPGASQALARLNEEMEELLGLCVFEDERTPVERVAEHAIDEVERVLPHGARVWIHNTATVNLGMVNDVIDNMVSTFIGAGIPIVERQLIDLIVAEQDLHLSGAISDNDFISIGNLAGANTIVAVGITGAGAARRLQVRVLDIETATVMMQSGTGALWSL